MNVLTVRDARKKFGNVAALNGATFELRHGELLALLGPNGAGKTTLIRAITGRVRLDGGEIRLFDRVLDGKRTAPELGIVPQEIALYPLLTARENLEAFGGLHGLSGKDLAGQVDWALERTGLLDRATDLRGVAAGHIRRLHRYYGRDAANGCTGQVMARSRRRGMGGQVFPAEPNGQSQPNAARPPRSFRQRGDGSGVYEVVHPDHQPVAEGPEMDECG